MERDDAGVNPEQGAPTGDSPPPTTDQVTDPPAAGDQPGGTPPDGVQRRIDELTRKRRAAEREADYWRGVAEASQKPEKNPEKNPASTDLDPSDFDSDADYLKAVAKQAREEIRREAEAERNKRTEADRVAAIQRATAEARKKYSDFDDVALVDSNRITQAMFEAAVGDQLGDILYYFGRNTAEARRIAALPASQQIKEVGKLEAKLTLAPLRTTNAPPPTPTVQGGGSPSPKDESEMSRSELHDKWEKERLARLGVKNE